MEEYKPILDYPDYEVSNLGNVRNIKTGRILKPRNNDGYYRVLLNNKNKRIHRLVALTFLPNPDNKTDVDHIDRNRTNNVVSNLRWVSRSENCLNTKSRDRELFGIYYREKKQKYQVVLTIDRKLKSIGYRKTLEEATILRDTFLKQDNKNL